MDIKSVIEDSDGKVEFTGTLEGKELQAVIEVGLNVLFQNGCLPFQMIEDKNEAQVCFPLSETQQ